MKKIIHATLIAIILFSSLVSCDSKNKIGFVKSQELVYGYQGMKEAKQKFEDEKLSVQESIDSLISDYRISVQNYENDKLSLSITEQQQRENLLNIQYQRVAKRNAGIEQNLKAREDQIMTGVLNQINSFVEQYGKANGYDLILGTTLSGSVLYGNEAIDLTKIILKDLNKNYQSE